MTEERPVFEAFDLSLKAPAVYEIEIPARNRRLLFDAYTSLLAGDHDALFNLCAPDLTYILPPSLPYGCVKTGVEGARAGVAGAFGAWSRVKCEIQEFVATGDLVIAFMQVALTGRATGEVYEGPTAETFRFRDGRIIEWRVIYWDTHRVRKVCGLDQEVQTPA